MHTHKFKHAPVCLLLTAAFLLSGCSVKNEKALLRSAQDQYGSCKLLSSDEGEKSRTLTLEDKQYGFTYHISSSLSAVMIDGSDFGDAESTSSDFPVAYSNCFLAYHLPELTQLEEQYSVHYDFCNNYQALILMQITAKDETAGKQGAEAAARIINAYDTRHFWSNFVFSVDDAEGKHLGSYSLSELRFLDPEEESISTYTHQAESIYGLKDVKFVEKELKTFADTGLTADDVIHMNDDNSPREAGDPVAYYWFESDGKRFFIADFLSSHTGTNYTNVYEVFPE